MFRQTIRTFYEVRGGAVKVLRTDPVIIHREVKGRSGGGGDAEGSVKQKEESPD